MDQGAFNYTILCEGQQLPAKFAMSRLEIVAQANRLTYAELIFHDGDLAKEKWELSDSTHFKPGAKVEIKLRRGSGRDADVFQGIVVRHRIGATRAGTQLTINLKSPAYGLASVRRTSVYRKKTDSDIMRDLIKQGSLKVGQMHTTNLKHEEMVQLNCSNWDFLLARAEANGFWVVLEDDTVHVIDPSPKGVTKTTFKPATASILAIDMEVDIRHQAKALTSRSWDLKKQELGKEQKAAEAKLEQGEKNEVDDYAKAVGADTRHLPGGGSLQPDELKALATGRMRADRMGLVRGLIEILGKAAYAVGDMVELTGFGKRFKGKNRVAGVRHLADSAGWTTEIQLGVHPEWLSANRDLAPPPANGLLAPIHGLHIGVVNEFKEDPEDNFRIRVQVPALGPKDNLLWARLATPEAGKERGFFFCPEEGDEVVLGFFDDDPRQPVILGSMFNPENKPPFALDKDNFEKGIKTREGSLLTFNDDKDGDKMTATLTTSEKYGLTVTEGKTAHLLCDKEKLEMDSEKGIAITAAGDMTLITDKKLATEDGSGLELISGAAVAIEGKTMEAKAPSIKLKGNVAVE